ncbi:MAG: hypothetical protein A2504_13500 [Bdellovibrionales bacterium RIFOXYD12_FULL_39_22]|nr:MAG: hypothetical protein A2385_01300 [Bdellovibrionales bacterium RIFOXYB1_FULL_39_21]OFZ43641.1 MAG: hypothetical protein A2485_12970 [Bdellovibrionales bacterium RIFOXYC12_FULL_39_17]OFZ44660.1 MAG: hypothetical protein A2404_10660 [Bdellovibrionales bacterium RIFOXYC1_FULL_39_130]OFZ71029.1 MAG: hypothetical protein A2451_13860 [Bdellovibrionales bacterium RIFOXYC2_FULL_39_8]OFZ76419.1 MAG: hypothetical protein A2560_07280 [Bdellovibrionales bacterium RIFOXYD1_FULL_39_84]OFZ94685.1 MAG:
MAKKKEIKTSTEVLLGNQENKAMIDNIKKKIEEMLRKKTENSKKAAQIIAEMLEKAAPKGPK